MAWLALGLAEAQLGHSLEALEAFQRADQVFPQSEMVKYFIGREYLFLVDRESVLQFARDAFEQEADQAFQEAILLNKDYARAYIGLGGVNFKRAQRLINPSGVDTSLETGKEAPGIQDIELAESLAQESLAAYNQVLEINPDPADYGLPLVSVARLGLGNTYRLLGQISWLAGNQPEAFAYLDQAIQALESTISPLMDAGQERYLTQAYEYLGATHQWRAYLFELNQDYNSSLDSYQESIAYYERCIAQGEKSDDRIIREEIIARICIPSHARIRAIIDGFDGGQG